MTFDDVRKIALAWPEVDDGTSYGTPALRVRKKLLARLEHVVFFQNRDSQRGGFLIQTPCWVKGASMDDATLFGGHSRTRSCSG